MRQSAIQRWAANRLYRAGAIDVVMIETGSAIAEASAPIGAGRIKRFARHALSSPVAAVGRIFNRRHWQAWYGENGHDRRLLADGYDDLDDALERRYVGSVNSEDARLLICELRPSIVLVFGTRIVTPATMACAPDAHWLNMHWGWSPDYRAEGIVSALGTEGPGALGVTVHRLSSAVDGGNIVAQSRPTVDAADNFYSLGLKLGMLGTALFIDVVSRLHNGEAMAGEPQNLSRGRDYSSAYMRDHPQLYRRAWRALHGEVS